MSTKTTFKRIALVAVAALGLGVLSVAPSSAVATGTALSGVGNGTATFRSGISGVVDSDTTTGAAFTVSSLVTSTSDTVTVTFYEKSRPTGATATSDAGSRALLQVIDTTTANSYVSATTLTTAAPVASNMGRRVVGSSNNTESVTAGNIYQVLSGGSVGVLTRSNTTGPIGATFALFLESNSAQTTGSYVYTVVATTYSNTGGSNYTVTTNQTDVTIVVSATAATALTTGKTPTATGATAWIGTATGPSADAVVTSVSTASTTSVAFIKVSENNTNGTAAVAEDSLTATLTGPGLICDGSVCGKSLTAIALTAGTKELTVRADGNAGVASIAISSTVQSFPAKTVTFFAKAAKTITAKVNNPVLVVGSNTQAISATAVDANGTAWTGQMYIVASAAADALVGGSATTPVKCSFDTTDLVHYCPVTTIAAGTAKFKLIDASTVALATATSNEVTVSVSANTAATVKIAFDKATYAPFEKAKITITPLDSTGNALGTQTAAALVTVAGITSDYAFGAGSDTTTAAGGITTSALTGAKSYTVYMPAQGTVTITATGGTALPASGQVAVTAKATVVNSSVDAATDAANEATDAANAATDAALAAADAADAATAAAQDASDAVAALSASVEKLVASLKAQLTSLTNLVIKIQKKVKA